MDWARTAAPAAPDALRRATPTDSIPTGGESSAKRRAHLSTARRRDQGAVVGFVLGTLLALAPAARGAGEPPDARDAALRRRPAADCDVLLRRVKKTPYGWVWNWSDADPADGRGGRAPRPSRVVTFDAASTAAGGLALHLAGARAGDESYRQAAAQAGRALAAVQSGNGQLPATGVIGAHAGGRDEPRAVPSRAATVAGLGLLLTLVHDAPADDPNAARFRAAASKAAHWLASQQTRDGGWLASLPPDAAPGQGERIVRLDLPDYRDATIALWLAGRVLDDERLARKAGQAVEDLVSLRIEDDRGPGRHLWASAYSGDGVVRENDRAFPVAVDTVATRNAMQALLAACLLGDAEATTPPLRDAVDALAKLPKDDGAWLRYYLLKPAPEPAAPPPREDGEPAPPLFEEAKPDRGQAELAAGLDEVVRAAKQLAEQGPPRMKQSLESHLPIEQRLALVLCGITDEAIAFDLPAAGPNPAAREFDARLRRIAELAWRVK
jgi:hypothetical protein